MSKPAVICLYGGAFDPVHNGHLRIAYEASRALSCERLYFVPTGLPAHRDKARLTAQRRLKLLQLAVEKNNEFAVSDFELQRAEQGVTSYAVDTASEFQRRFPDASLCWLMGSDAFAGYTKWHQWQALLAKVNIIIAGRPGTNGYNAEVSELLQQNQIFDVAELPKAGAILPIDVTQLDISSTAIHEQLKQGVLPNYLVPDAVASALKI